MPVLPPSHGSAGAQAPRQAGGKEGSATAGKPVRLLLTGFGPFLNVKINPAMLIGQALAGERLEGPPEPIAEGSREAVSTNEAAKQQQGVGVARDGHEKAATGSQDVQKHRPRHGDSSRAVDITFHQLNVSYAEVSQQLPVFHQSDEFDAFLHVGVAMGYKQCTLETVSDRLGYDTTHPDVDGKTAPAVEGGFGLEGDVSRWDTAVDTGSLLEYLQGRQNVKLLRESPDPGGYLCGFSYATSLKAAIATAKDHGRDRTKPVLFIHVPGLKENDAGPYTLPELCTLVRSAAWWLGQCV